jgi:predicted nucleic acid-binding protein
MESVYWDANVFNAIFGKEEGRVKKCLEIEKSAREGRVLIYTSAVTFVECIWIKGNPDKLSEEHEKTIQKYFMHKFIRIITCDRQIAESARSIIWKFPHLKPKDAIHVASALSQDLETLHTYDNDDLVKFSGKMGNPKLKMCNPESVITQDFNLAE